MLVLCGLALAAATVVVVGQGRPRYGGYHYARLEVGGDSYQYLVFVPPAIAVLRRCPGGRAPWMQHDREVSRLLRAAMARSPSTSIYRVVPGRRPG